MPSETPGHTLHMWQPACVNAKVINTSAVQSAKIFLSSKTGRWSLKTKHVIKSRVFKVVKWFPHSTWNITDQMLAGWYVDGVRNSPSCLCQNSVCSPLAPWDALQAAIPCEHRKRQSAMTWLCNVTGLCFATETIFPQKWLPHTGQVWLKIGCPKIWWSTYGFFHQFSDTQITWFHHGFICDANFTGSSLLPIAKVQLHIWVSDKALWLAPSLARHEEPAAPQWNSQVESSSYTTPLRTADIPKGQLDSQQNPKPNTLLNCRSGNSRFHQSWASWGNVINVLFKTHLLWGSSSVHLRMSPIMFETAQIFTNLSPVFLVHVSVILEYCLNVTS